ncbi:uncharacterized protein LOC143952815 [Lithobates pipiens]
MHPNVRKLQNSDEFEYIRMHPNSLFRILVNYSFLSQSVDSLGAGLLAWSNLQKITVKMDSSSQHEVPPPGTSSSSDTATTTTTSTCEFVPPLSVSCMSASVLLGPDSHTSTSTQRSSRRVRSHKSTFSKDKQMKQQKQLACPVSVPQPKCSGRSSSCKRPSSDSAMLRPPSKQKRSERETVGSKSPTSRAERSCSETRKQSASIACRRLFQDLPPRTTCTITTSASCVTTTSAMRTLRNVVTPSLFYRKGLTLPATQAFDSKHQFKQPKSEIFEYEQDILCAHSSTTTTIATPIGTTITTEKITSTGHRSNEGDFLVTFPISHPREEGVQPVPPTSDVDKSSFANMEDSDYTLPFNLDQELNIYEPEYSPSHIKFDSPLLYSPERTAPVAPASPVPVESPINIRAASTTVNHQVTSFTIPDMRPPPILSQKHCSIAECTGQATTKIKQVALASAAEEEILSKKSSPHSGSTRRSKIWQHFVTVGDGRTATCKICSREVSRGRLLGHLTKAGMKQHML